MWLRTYRNNEIGCRIMVVCIIGVLLNFIDLFPFSLTDDGVWHISGSTQITPQNASSSLHQAATENHVQLSKVKIEEWKGMAHTLVWNMPIAQMMPDKKRPFVYFHTRKAGGSTVRGIINDMAQREGIAPSKRWLPCYADRGCVPYSLPRPDKDYVVYAGHLNFMHMTNLMRETKVQNILLQQTETVKLKNGKNIVYHHLDDSYRLFDCVTTIRPTVKRVISCWNFRFNKENRSPGFPLPRASTLDAQDLAKLLPKAYDEYGGGCNNEMARIFGSTVDETYINTLSPSHPGFVQELNNVASRMSKCLVIRVDRCEDSNAIIEHFIPWMNGTDVCSHHENAHGKTSDEVISEEAKAGILEQNYFDELIFDLGEELFEQQLNRSKGFG